MKKVLLASVATGALAIAAGVTGALTTVDNASAADLRMPLKAPPPPAPIFSWSGCYVGANWGWGWGKKTGQGLSNGSATSWGSFDNNKLSGPVFGGQLGCNYQWPGSNFVVGIQGDYDAADISGTVPNSFDPFPGFNQGSETTKIDSIGSVTGRLGWNGWDPQVLFYVKGGWAWMHERDQLQNFTRGYYGSSRAYSYTFSGSSSGWTIGGGVEWALAFAPKWSVFAEYDYYSFGHKTLDLCPGCSTETTTVHTNVNVVKVGVNYRFLNPF